MPEELENLIEIARIKELCRKENVVKISQKRDGIVFYYNKDKMDMSKIDNLIKKYEMRLKFSTGIEPYITLKIECTSDKDLIEQIKEFLR